MADSHTTRLSYGTLSDEVADDYRKALEDLTMNSRYEISNLTVIAKENTEHALAISEALKNHIKQTSPAKKLPAFYVLDSVVKNVGTPYTLFFGRQLYSTFMEAYALVDNNVRRKMDEMLKTWKEPVPGSIDTRPVFPPEVTRPIENALIKARTSAVQAHQEHLRNQQQIMGRRPNPSPTPFRDTPTPPGAVRHAIPGAPGHGYPPNYGPQSYPPPAGGQPFPNPMNGHQQYGLPQRPPNQQYPNPSGAAPSWQQPQPQGYPTPENSVDTLTSDIANLIATSKADFAQNPWDSSIQTRLKALLDLQTILSSQKLPPDQIALIKDQVAQLSEASKPSSRIQTPLAPVPPPAPVAVAPSPAQQPTLSSLLGPGALAALLASQSATPQPTPPVQAQPFAPVRSPPPSHAQPSFNTLAPAVSSSTPVPDPASLLEKLRAAGMLPAIPTSTATPSLPLGTVVGSVPPSIMPPFISTPPSAARTPLADLPNDVVLRAASLKIPRPHLISSLYERLGAPCTQCGRRFQSDEEGRKKKTIHMDWHFRVHQRMTEAEKRGQHRSWYVDELDWIKSREVEDDQNTGSVDGIGLSGTGSGATSNKPPELQYIPVPDDPPNSFCPICQEKFEMKWLDDAQEFVWMDARKIGDRIYHATCYAEATKDGGGGGVQQVKRLTPEPVLGKRKAEDEHFALRGLRVKTEAQV